MDLGHILTGYGRNGVFRNHDADFTDPLPTEVCNDCDKSLASTDTVTLHFL